ncbi:MAG: ERAP1-like C-terminal domain-containing protein, partial [Candidatus Saccharimonadales bacterium]|nr:ERAP1-like C-terminal domain-containing protein [Candidatus Saccharimonadales bacterium]
IISLEQERFLLNSTAAKDSSVVWPIPIDVIGSDAQFTLDTKQNSWQLSPSKVKLNSKQTGFFIVKYDDDWLKLLAELAQSKSIEPVERLGILNDRFELAKGGYSDTVSALKLLEKYSAEDSTVVWDVIAGQLGAIRRVFDSDQLEENMKPYMHKLSESQVERLGWRETASESHFDKLLRPLILGISSYSENEAVVEEALKRYGRANAPEELEPNLRGPILGTVARRGETGDFNQLLEWYKKTDSAQIKLSLAGALASFKDQKLTDTSLKLIQSDHVRLQEVLHWLSFLFGNRHAKHKTWQWMTSHWDWLEERFGTDIMTFMYFPRMAGGAFSSTDFLDEYDRFFKSVGTKGIQRAVDQGREKIVWQSAWRTRDEERIIHYFEASSFSIN